MARVLRLSFRQTCVKFNQAFDLKEEEEGKRTGTVTWRLYWKYFKEGLSVPLIMHVAVALILSQGNSSCLITLIVTRTSTSQRCLRLYKTGKYLAYAVQFLRNFLRFCGILVLVCLNSWLSYE